MPAMSLEPARHVRRRRMDGWGKRLPLRTNHRRRTEATVVNGRRRNAEMTSVRRSVHGENSSRESDEGARRANLI